MLIDRLARLFLISSARNANTACPPILTTYVFMVTPRQTGVVGVIVTVVVQ
jgi:hypothetical protein